MKKALSLILVCLFLVSMMIPVSAAQFINAYETIQAENYSEASCASVLGLGSTHYLENCLDAGGGKNVFDRNSIVSDLTFDMFIYRFGKGKDETTGKGMIEHIHLAIDIINVILCHG